MKIDLYKLKWSVYSQFQSIALLTYLIQEQFSSAKRKFDHSHN